MKQKPPLAFRIIGTIFYFGPLIFAFGFIAPLTSQLLSMWGYEAIAGVPVVVVGLVVALVWGSWAQWRGKWI